MLEGSCSMRNASTDMATGPQTLSIISVALNERPHLQRLKTGIEKLSLPAGVTVETILVDGGSTDGTVELARQLGFSEVVVLDGASIPVCRNEGLRKSSGDWIAFVDADCEVAEEWLTEAVPWLESGEATIIGWPVTPPVEGTWVQRAWHQHWLHKNARTQAAQEDGIRHEAFRLITTRNMLLNRAVADRLGGFDESLTTGEDTDFVFRAYVEGIDVVGVPTLRIVHHGEPETVRDFFRQQLWHANRSSYAKIMQLAKGRLGSNAPLFTMVFVVALALLLAGVALSLYTGTALWLLMGLPLLCVIGGPAALIASRAKSIVLFFQLALLYAAYGLARGLDLIGAYRQKTSWKASY